MRKERRGRKILLAFCCLAGVAAAIPSSVMALDDYAIGEKCWKEGRYRDAYSHLWRYRETSYGRSAYVDYMLKTYFRRAFEYIFQRIWAIDDSVSISFHGYGHAPPDGRGVIRIPFVDFQFIGPWLRPALTAKGYTERLERERLRLV